MEIDRVLSEKEFKDFKEFQRVLDACETEEKAAQAGCLMTEKEFAERIRNNDFPILSMVKFPDGTFSLYQDYLKGEREKAMGRYCD